MAKNQSTPPSARLLDLTRLISRIGRGPWTGIDRVEAAYLHRLLQDPVPLFALIQTSLGFVILDRDGLRGLRDRLTGQHPWGPPDLLSRAFLQSNPARRAAESDLRRMCLGRSRRGGLAAMLKRHLPAGFAYLNVGHTNLQPHVFAAIRGIPETQITVLIHDTIPLDFPEYQRPGTVESFRARLHLVGAGADLVICNSQVTRASVERHFAEWGPVPPCIVAHLGIDRPVPDAAALAAIIDISRPYFVSVGTIEPRKNHALLLDIWDAFARSREPGEIPALYIVGRRGWNNRALFDRLDSSPLSGRHVFELSDLSDGAMAALLANARAMLFPSHAEGFGLPPCEAVALDVPVLVNDLPVYREILGNKPIYAKGADMYSWQNTITNLAVTTEAGQSKDTGADRSRALPTWQHHFNLVLKVT